MMIENRPEFKSIKSFDEFEKYYWYRKELAEICKSLDLEHRGTKKELNQIIKAYFDGDLIRKTSKKVPQKRAEEISLDTPLLS